MKFLIRQLKRAGRTENLGGSHHKTLQTKRTNNPGYSDGSCSWLTDISCSIPHLAPQDTGWPLWEQVVGYGQNFRHTFDKQDPHTLHHEASTFAAQLFCKGPVQALSQADRCPHSRRSCRGRIICTHFQRARTPCLRLK